MVKIKKDQGYFSKPRDLMDEKIKLQIEKNTSDIAEIIRRLNSIDGYIQLVYKDRELINELRDSVAGLKQRLVDNTQHQDNVAQDIKLEIHEKAEDVKDTIKDTGDEIKEDVAKGVVGTITENKGIIEKIFKK